jgi:nitric oxide reductase large subunit
MLSVPAGKILFAIALLPILPALWIYHQHPIFSPEHRVAFTELMRLGGLTALPLTVVVIWSLIRADKPTPENRHLRAALYSSLFLFGAGGIIGFMIEGVNVIIPAHYHGSIIGVTIAFMGVAYYLLPRLGYPLHNDRMAYYQPYIYAVGQSLHILGLAWSGGHGVQRKTAGVAQGLDSLEKQISMGVMGIGGLISIIGGALFLVVAIRALWKGRKKAVTSD